MPLCDAECRLLVIAIGKDIEKSLRNIAEISETARQLYAIIITRRGYIWTEEKKIKKVRVLIAS